MTGHAFVAGGGEGQAHSGSAPASEQEGPCLFPSRRKRTRQVLDQVLHIIQTTALSLPCMLVNRAAKQLNQLVYSCESSD